MTENNFLVKENQVIQKIHRRSDWTESKWWADQSWPLAMHVPQVIPAISLVFIRHGEFLVYLQFYDINLGR